MKYINELAHLLFPSCNKHLQMSLNIVPCSVLELCFCCDVLIWLWIFPCLLGNKGHQQHMGCFPNVNHHKNILKFSQTSVVLFIHTRPTVNEIN